MSELLIRIHPCMVSSTRWFAFPSARHIGDRSSSCAAVCLATLRHPSRPRLKETSTLNCYQFPIAIACRSHGRGKFIQFLLKLSLRQNVAHLPHDFTMDVPQWPSSDTPQAGQQWLDASSSSSSFQTPKKLHMQSQRDPWLQWMGPLDGSFTFSSVPIEEEPELVHNGHPIEGLSSIDTRLAQFDGGKPQFGGEDRMLPKVGGGPRSRPLSMISLASATSSGSCLSSVQTDVSDVNTVIGMSREASPQKGFAVPTPQAYPEHGCNWGGCAAVFKTHTALSWHVKAEHLLICPAAGCDEGPFSSAKLVGAHVDVVHLKKERSVKEWSLEVGQKTVNHDAEEVVGCDEKARERTPVKMGSAIEAKKRKCMDDLDKAVERRAKRGKKMTSEPTPDVNIVLRALIKYRFDASSQHVKATD